MQMRVRINCLASIVLSIVLTLLLNFLLRGCSVFYVGGVRHF